jgi:hypothetical protein
MPTKDEHLKNLSAARQKAVDQRRSVAAALAKGGTDKTRESFLLLHDLIGAIDYAIKDEDRLG